MAVSVQKRDAYIGETKKHIRNGYGVYAYQNKFFRYEGEWQDGKKHGHGKLMMKDGSYYEGEFTRGEITGHGFRYWAHSENTFTGQFYMGELQGQGIMTYKDGSVYEGEWWRNRREGYGRLRLPDNSVYQGHLHDHKKHGEGTQIYSNGDRYDGDWILDKRQGHGELCCSDGSVYDGQWSNDMYNGQGTFSHSSGITYDGLWINGQPAVMTAKLSIKTTGPVEVMQGFPFVLEVECLTEDGEVAEVDKGRELQVTAGFRFTPPRDSSSRSRESSTLFDTIEDIEEKPLETPFGYSVVSYPLTEILPEELRGEPGMLSKSNTVLSEQVIQEDTEHTTDGEGENVADESKDGAVTESAATAAESAVAGSAAGAGSSEVTVEVAATEETAPSEGMLLPPPVTSKRTDKGGVIWTNLFLPAAPPMYRPFLLQDEDEKMKRAKSRSSTSLKDKKSEEESSRPGSKIKKEKSSVTDEKSAKPGEYVLIVQDVTNPPFMDKPLEPAFILIKVIPAPKQKSRKSTAGSSKKDKGPRRIL